MYDDEFELTFNLQDEDAAPVELPKAAEEAGPEAPAETREPAADEEPTIVLPDRRPEPAGRSQPQKRQRRTCRSRKHPQHPNRSRRHRPGLPTGGVC